MIVTNPILPGFNADPAILRVSQDYYIATSTFEWFPGVSIYHSRDLANWRHITNALSRRSQLDLRGVGDSCGVWAPDLTFNLAEQRFYLAYTLMKRMSPRFFDLDNYVVTAPAVTGPWGDPVYLNSSGFDPAFVHQADGRTWVTNLCWETRQGYPHPGWITLQEYHRGTQRLIGDPVRIYDGDRHFGCTEGPRIYHIGEHYYLLTAEGGTGYGHAVLVSRAREITGPYEPSPYNPLLTSRANPHPSEPDYDPDYLKPRFFNPAVELQKAGHGALVQTPAGEWFLSHLCARPIRPFLRSMLGRETALQRVEWTTDRWPRLAGDGLRSGGDARGSSDRFLPTVNVEAPDAVPAPGGPQVGPAPPVAAPTGRLSFAGSELPPYLHSLRSPIDESWVILTRAPGRLSLRGRDSLYSMHEQSLIARRIQHFAFEAETTLHYLPRHHQEAAGLICLFSRRTWYYLRLYWSESFGSPCLGIAVSSNEKPRELREHRVPLTVTDAATGGVALRVSVDTVRLQFSYARDDEWHPIGPELDATVLADEASDQGAGAFSGAFVGLCAQDLRDKAAWAEFDYLEYTAGRPGERST